MLKKDSSVFVNQENSHSSMKLESHVALTIQQKEKHLNKEAITKLSFDLDQEKLQIKLAMKDINKSYGIAKSIGKVPILFVNEKINLIDKIF